MDIQSATEIEGWMSIRELEWLAEIASRSNHILEVGCYAGRSTKAMADNTKAFIDVIDPLEGDYFKDSGEILFTHNNTRKVFINNLEEFLASGQMRLIERRFEDVKYAPEVKFDFIFIDGDHRYEQVRKDIYKAWKLLKLGGVISGHDYGQKDWPGVKKAVDDFFGSTVKLIDTIWYVECIE